ncbi:hypothetical protein DUNSADRAFT_14575 [Dunaliella salina]|uniref:Uncharacterized protein n=1 Tax=Dunaliella salina TaxID=3046 RepID=A0ABQ7G745_DUNSA|nr:hypothetical protein DUNSADRAFT_14575 [Dunaliella salina]|eukprot:KAF5830437.1 hypothetical protein DUNSADRAFT_14575 [Dunaliella salina]
MMQYRKLAQREQGAARKEEQLLELEREVQAATYQGAALVSREDTLAKREAALERAQQALVQEAQEMDARRTAAREQMAKLHAERQALQERKEGAGMELHAECELLTSNVERLSEERDGVLTQISTVRLEWERDQKADIEAMLNEQKRLRLEDERQRSEAALLSAQHEERVQELQQWRLAEEEKLARREAQVESDEARLNALSPELQEREKEVNALRERVRAELDAARQLAANAAADRAQLDVREHEVGQREREAQDLVTKTQAEGQRKLKEREALLTEWQQRLESQQNDLVAAQNELQLGQQKSSMENELRARELEVAGRELAGRVRTFDATEAQAAKDRLRE